MYYDYFLQWHATAQKDIQVGKFCGEASVNLSKAVFFPVRFGAWKRFE